MDKKPAYKRCPRCELNYIKFDEELCNVCQAEINARKEHDNLDLEMELCPICKSNYISENEIMCPSCMAEKGDEIDDIEDWDEYIDEEEDELSDEDEEIGAMSSVSEEEDLSQGIDLGINLDDDDEMSFEDLDTVAEEEFGEGLDDEDLDDDLDDDFDDDFDDDDDEYDDDDDDDDYDSDSDDE